MDAAREFFKEDNTLSIRACSRKHGASNSSVHTLVKEWRNSDVHYAIREARDASTALLSMASSSASTPSIAGSADVTSADPGSSSPSPTTSDDAASTTRTPMTTSDPYAPFGYSSSGTPLTGYEAAYKWATKAVSSGELSSRNAAVEASVKFNTSINKTVIASTAIDPMRVGRTPVKVGRHTTIPLEGERKLVNFQQVKTLIKRNQLSHIMSWTDQKASPTKNIYTRESLNRQK